MLEDLLVVISKYIWKLNAGVEDDADFEHSLLILCNLHTAYSLQTTDRLLLFSLHQ